MKCSFHCSGKGGWDGSDIDIDQESHNGYIRCHSFHLTSFAVLVDISGGSTDQVHVTNSDYANHVIVVCREEKRKLPCQLYRTLGVEFQ